MSVRLVGDTISLEGECRVEDAEALVSMLETGLSRPVDVSQCRLMHGAVLQALLHYRPHLIGAFADVFMARWVQPKLSFEQTSERT